MAISNKKAVKSAAQKATKEGRTLSRKEKDKVRADNNQRNKNLNNANKTRESIRNGIDYGIDYAKGSYENYKNKIDQR